MEVEVKVVIEPSERFMQILEALIGNPAIASSDPAPAETLKRTRKPKAEVKEEPTAVETALETPKEESAKEVSAADLRDALRKIANDDKLGGQPKAVEILKKHSGGKTRIADVPEDKWPNIYRECQEVLDAAA